MIEKRVRIITSNTSTDSYSPGRQGELAIKNQGVGVSCYDESGELKFCRFTSAIFSRRKGKLSLIESTTKLVNESGNRLELGEYQ